MMAKNIRNSIHLNWNPKFASQTTQAWLPYSCLLFFGFFSVLKNRHITLIMQILMSILIWIGVCSLTILLLYYYYYYYDYDYCYYYDYYDYYYYYYYYYYSYDMSSILYILRKCCPPLDQIDVSVTRAFKNSFTVALCVTWSLENFLFRNTLAK